MYCPLGALGGQGKHTLGGEDICVDDWTVAVWFWPSTNPEFSSQAAVTYSSPTEKHQMKMFSRIYSSDSSS